MTRYRCLAALLIVSLLTVTAAAQRERVRGFDGPPSKALAAVFEKAGTVSYAGVRKVEFRSRDGFRSLNERILRQGWKMRIEYQGGSAFDGQVIVEDGRTRLHLIPKLKQIRKLPSRRDEILFGLSGSVMRSLDPEDGRPTMSEVNGGKIAGVGCQLIHFKRANGTSIQKMWIDQRRGAILKREIMDSRGRVSARYTFQRIKFDPEIEANTFGLKTEGVEVVTMDQLLARAAKSLKMRPYRLPESRSCRLVFVSKRDTEEFRSLIQVYSCDEGRMTLFQVDGDLNREALHKLARGRYLVHSWKKSGRSFALIGRLDEKELKEYAGKVAVKA
jgi:outer membrane lipoprotein-sorting protein